MNTLQDDLRQVFIRRFQEASSSQILTMAASMCAAESRAPSIEQAVPASAPNPRFLVEGDVVTDRFTGLMWTRANVAGGRMNWTEAKKAAEAVTLGGHTDWKLPTIRQLLSIVDYERSSPSIDPAFECDSAWYWSSTPYQPSLGDCAWVVHFGSGRSDWSNQTVGYHVRAVRAGQLVGNWVW